MKALYKFIFALLFVTSSFAQEYSGGIETSTGFKLSDPQPLDDRTVVADSLSLLGLPNQYDGLTAYSQDDESLFVKTSNGWKRVGKDSAIPTIQQTIDAGNTVWGTVRVNNWDAFSIRSESEDYGKTGMEIHTGEMFLGKCIGYSYFKGGTVQLNEGGIQLLNFQVNEDNYLSQFCSIELGNEKINFNGNYKNNAEFKDFYNIKLGSNTLDSNATIEVMNDIEDYGSNSISLKVNNNPGNEETYTSIYQDYSSITLSSFKDSPTESYNYFLKFNNWEKFWRLKGDLIGEDYNIPTSSNHFIQKKYVDDNFITNQGNEVDGNEFYITDGDTHLSFKNGVSSSFFGSTISLSAEESSIAHSLDSKNASTYLTFNTQALEDNELIIIFLPAESGELVLKDYVDNNFLSNSTTLDLQTILNNGNSATDSGIYFKDSGEVLTTYIDSSGLIVSDSTSEKETFILPGAVAIQHSDNSITIQSEAITEDRIQNLQDKSGTIALTDDVNTGDHVRIFNPSGSQSFLSFTRPETMITSYGDATIINLPDPSTHEGKKVYIKTDKNDLVVGVSNGLPIIDKIRDKTGTAVSTITVAYYTVLISNGTYWEEF